MSGKVYIKYRVWCNTTSSYQYWILESSDAVPTTCPVNTGHTIDTAQTVIIKRIEEDNDVIPPTTIDGFGRLKIAKPQTLFDSKLLNRKGIIDWTELTSGSGATSYTSQFPYFDLTVGPGVGRAVRQTRRYMPYQPGKDLQLIITGVLSIDTPDPNVVSRIGYFDDASDKTTGSDVLLSNGFYFEFDGTTFNVVKRSFITGSLVETRIAQSAFNVDKLDGLGLSGYNIDVTKRQIFVISIEWLGVGTVVMGIQKGNTLIPCHQWDHENVGDPVPYINTGSLPVRYEIEAFAGATSATLREVCCTAISSGGYEPIGNRFSASTGLTVINNIPDEGSPAPLIALRIGSNGTRTTLKPENLNVMCVSSGNMYWVVYHVLAPNNPFTSVTWNAVNTNFSSAEYAINNTAKSALTWAGGFPSTTNATMFKIADGYFSSDVDFGIGEVSDRLLLAADIGGVSDILVLACFGVATSVEDVLAGLSWQEFT